MGRPANRSQHLETRGPYSDAELCGLTNGGGATGGVRSTTSESAAPTTWRSPVRDRPRRRGPRPDALTMASRAASLLISAARSSSGTWTGSEPSSMTKSPCNFSCRQKRIHAIMGQGADRGNPAHCPPTGVPPPHRLSGRLRDQLSPLHGPRRGRLAE